MLTPHFTRGSPLHLRVSVAMQRQGEEYMLLPFPLLVHTHGGHVTAALTLGDKWQIWIMRINNPTKINSRHGGLTWAKSSGCYSPASDDYTPDALNNAPRRTPLKAWNPWSIRADLSFAINIPLCLGFGGWHCTFVCCCALKQTLAKPLRSHHSVAIFLAEEYSTGGCHNKGNNKRGHAPALHGAPFIIYRKKAMSLLYLNSGKLNDEYFKTHKSSHLTCIYKK